MNTTVFAAIISAALAIASGFSASQPTEPQPHKMYIRDCTVIDIREPDHTAIVADPEGFVWAFDAQDLLPGDHFLAVFDDNGTTAYFDDEYVCVLTWRW